ncbi:MAG: glycosyltransferase family 2 protein, partial [Cyanobacteria bacterium J06598_1]
MSDSADKPLSEQASSELGDDDLVIDEFFRGYAGRRLKAAIALITLWLLTAFLHSFIWGNQLVLVATGLIAIHTLRVMLAKPRSAPAPLPTMNSSAALSDSALSSSYPSDSHSADAITTDPERWPYVSLLVAAKNEEHVIGNLVEALLQIDYPATRYDLWFINDNSSDRTAQILDDLSALYPRLNVVHRGPDATGGKSGALNLVWPKTKGDLLAVFDADARVPQDLLRYVVPMFDPQLGGSSKTGAVQVRKAIANASDNFWTRGQKAEMALDCHMQERRIAIGGIGELRGNGQFVRRRAIAQCGGWNEETITDDLDLTIQLHLHQWDIGLLFTP